MSEDPPEVKVPFFKSESSDEDWRTHLYNQERIINQQNALLEIQRRLVDAMEKIASPERTRKVEEGQARMTEAVDTLSGKMDSAVEQLAAGVNKLSSAYWGLMKVPVAMTVVGCSSWAFLYMEKINQTVWLGMVAVAVFPWLGESITAVARIARGNGGEKK